MLLSQEDKNQLSAAIAIAESHSSAEIRIHIESKCQDPLARAKQIFKKLGMHKTKLRNGVILYIASQDRKLAIFGDQGIHEQLDDNYWQQEKDLLIKAFGSEDFRGGIEHCIRNIGTKLQKYFPRLNNDENELSNEVSIGE